MPKSTGGQTTQDAKAGKLTLDTDKLTKALAADYTKVRDLFAGVGATKGISARSRTTWARRPVPRADHRPDEHRRHRLKDFTDQITKLNTRMETEQERLKAQFAAMESALNQSQTQQAWLTAQLSSLG